jgi:hypothetical protein
MPDRRITKRVVDGLRPQAREFAVWDGKLPGFGVRVRPSGAMSYVVVYRAGAGRGAPVRRFTIASVGKATPEAARARAKAILGAVAHGHDPAGEKATERGTLTISGLADRFMSEHVEQKRKPGTVTFYRHLLDKIIKPELGASKADKVTRAQVARLHGKLKATPFQANRVLAVMGSMYAFAGRSGIVVEGINPARRIEQFKEHRRERFLTGEELEGLGVAIREAETTGIPWEVHEETANSKHIAKQENRFHQDQPVCGGGAAPAAVHRLPPSRNPAPAVGSRRHRAWPVVSRRLQDRQENHRPERSGHGGAGELGPTWLVCRTGRRPREAARRS